MNKIIALLLALVLSLPLSATTSTMYEVDYAVRGAFYGVLRNAVDEYGVSRDFRDNGISSAWLIDFNNDNVPELMFSRNTYYGAQIYYYVYGYENGVAVRWFTGTAHPMSTGPSWFSVAESESGERFLLRSSAHMWSGTRMYHSFAHGESVVALSLAFKVTTIATEHGDDVEVFCYVNEEVVTEEVHDNAAQALLNVTAVYDLAGGDVAEMLARLNF